MESTSQSGGTVWVVLFGLIMGISLLGNLLFLSTLFSRTFSSLYKFHGLFFLLNLLSDALLLFEFTQMGTEHIFPFRVLPACLLYQNGLKIVPIVQAALIIFLGYHHFIQSSSLKRLKVLFFIGVILLSIPTTLYSNIQSTFGKNYCEVDLGAPDATSIYHLLYLALLTYWLPLLVSLYPIVKLIRQMDKNPEASITLSTIASYFVLYLPYAVIVTTRYSLILLQVPLSDHQIWMINVSQSLTWLLAYFWHFIRPSLIIVLDLEVKAILGDWIFGSSKGLIYGVITSSDEGEIQKSSPSSILKKIPTAEENPMIVI